MFSTRKLFVGKSCGGRKGRPLPSSGSACRLDEKKKLVVRIKLCQVNLINIYRYVHNDAEFQNGYVCMNVMVWDTLILVQWLDRF